MTNIMIVEDEGIVARDLGKRLARMGYEVVGVADSGEAALEKAPQVRPNLVLMDIILKGDLDGTQVADRLYHEYHIPVVYLTAHGDSATVQKAKETQPFGYVVKPFQEQELQTAIEMALVKHQAEETMRRSQAALKENNEALEARVAERTANLQDALDHLKQEIGTRKQTEAALKARDEQLRQAQKMEAVGRLAGGVTHDFNNQLAIIKGYVDMARDQVQEEHILSRYLSQINLALDRATSMTRQLLLFSSHQPLDPQVLSLNRHIDEFQKMLVRLLGEDIAISLDLEDNLWPVYADPVNIDQVVTNLSVNARDAMPKGGRLLLMTRNVVLDEAEAAKQPLGYAGRFVRLSVCDTGTGMDEEVLRRIFEPFFTTKGLGQGTGLGLSVVYGIAQSHGGWATVDSSPGKGSRFHVYLPASNGAQEMPAPANGGQASAAPGRGERVLLVEDDGDLREMLRVMLDGHGYEVHACADVETAHIAIENQEAFDLVLTDVTLPDGTGTELAVAAQEADPTLRAVLMTGYPEERLDLSRIRAAGLELVQKPVSMHDLLRVVRTTLHHGDANRV